MVEELVHSLCVETPMYCKGRFHQVHSMVSGGCQVDWVERALCWLYSPFGPVGCSSDSEAKVRIETS